MTVKEEARLEWDERKRIHYCPISRCNWMGWWVKDEQKVCPKCGDSYVREWR